MADVDDTFCVKVPEFDLSVPPISLPGGGQLEATRDYLRGHSACAQVSDVLSQLQPALAGLAPFFQVTNAIAEIASCLMAVMEFVKKIPSGVKKVPMELPAASDLAECTTVIQRVVVPAINNLIPAVAFPRTIASILEFFVAQLTCMDAQLSYLDTQFVRAQGILANPSFEGLDLVNLNGSDPDTATTLDQSGHSVGEIRMALCLKSNTETQAKNVLFQIQSTASLICAINSMASLVPGLVDLAVQLHGVDDQFIPIPSDPRGLISGDTPITAARDSVAALLATINSIRTIPLLNFSTPEAGQFGCAARAAAAEDSSPVAPGAVPETDPAPFL